MDPEEKAQNDKKRSFVVKEIISTERTYISRLQIAIDVYANPLKANRILDNNQFAAQFATLEKLYELHSKYNVPEEAADSLDFIALFDEITENFQIYSEYLVNYEPAMQKRGSLLTSSRKYSDFLDKQIKDPTSQGLTIESLLIMPVQRIPRYRMLIEQLLKYTDEEHPQYTTIKKALDKICDMAMFNNEAIRARENKTKTMAVMMTIEPRTRIDLLDDSTRQFVREGDLQRQCRRGLKEFHFWLFSDKLLYGQKLPLVGENYMLNREIPLSKCFVKLFDSVYDRSVTFMVQSPAKSFIVRVSSQQERDEWLKAIQDSIQKLRERGAATGGNVAPLWIPDATSTECQKCRGKFTLINRRHHCRNCGEMVCDTCSSKRHLLKDVNEKKEVRVCDDCHNDLTNKASSGGGGGNDELYESDEEAGEQQGDARGTLNEEDLNEFNDGYDDIDSRAASGKLGGSSGPTSPTTPSSSGGGGAGNSAKMKPRKSLFAFAEEQLSRLGSMMSGSDSNNSSMKSETSGAGPGTGGRPAPLNKAASAGDISPRRNHSNDEGNGNTGGGGHNSTNNPAFYNPTLTPVSPPPAGSPSVRFGADTTCGAPGGTAAAAAPAKPPKPIVKRRTNILRPEEMPKDLER